MGKPLIFDSTPLLHLTRASFAKFFKDLPAEKYTTLRVFNEVVQEGKKKGAPEASLVESLFKEKTITVRNPNDEEFFKFVKEMAAESEKRPLHEAEAEVLCLAKELNGVAIADDKVVRAVAKLLEMELHGTGYVIGKIYVTGKIKKEELIDKVSEMHDLGWHVSAEDYVKIIEYLNNL